MIANSIQIHADVVRRLRSELALEHRVEHVQRFAARLEQGVEGDRGVFSEIVVERLVPIRGVRAGVLTNIEHQALGT